MVVTEAPSVHRATEFVCQFYQQFIYKAFIPKELSRICTLHLRHSLCRRYLRNIAFTSVHSVTPCAHYISLLIYPPYFGRASYYPVTMSFIILLPCLEYPVTMSLITLSHVSHYPVSCIPLPCLMSSITLLPCLLLLCYHVSYYSVSCLPLPCRHQGMQNHKKRVDKLIIPRSHTPQNN